MKILDYEGSVFFVIMKKGETMQTILLVEDDIDIVNHLSSFLKNEGFQIHHVDGQRKAMDKIYHYVYDLILLDISLKEGNGFILYNEIKAYQDIPIVFLTASNDEFSVITGLNFGADDYIAKPFRPRELLSRIQNILKRYQKQDLTYQYKDLYFHTLTGKVLKGNRELSLTALEYKLLLIFFLHPQQILTREFLLEEIWNITGEDVSDNTLTVYIKRIRSKIEDDPQNPMILQTMRGLGYKLGD